MGDVKTNWNNVPVPTPGLGGDGVTARGTDPNVDVSGEGAIQSPWPTDKYATTNTQTNESANSVSGLPSLPARFEPSETPPTPPSLEDRNPGTIDKR